MVIIIKLLTRENKQYMNRIAPKTASSPLCLAIAVLGVIWDAVQYSVFTYPSTP